MVVGHPWLSFFVGIEYYYSASYLVWTCMHFLVSFFFFPSSAAKKLYNRYEAEISCASL